LASGAGSLSGTVTDAVTAAAVAAVAVQVYAPDGTLVKFTNTNLAGAFSVGGLAPGTYYARTAVPAGSVYDDQLFDGKACGATCTVTSGTAIVVTGGATLSGVDFKLTVKVITLSPTSLNFTGTNTSGALYPLTAPQNVAVTFPAGWTAAADQPWVQITNGSGTGNGTFTVGIINPNNILAGTTNATATVTVTPGVANSAPQTVTVNLTLPITPPTPAAGSISGQVKDSATNVGIAGARVQFYETNDPDGIPVATATADANGNYTQNLPGGTYGVLTQAPGSYINKVWNNISCSAVCDIGDEGENLTWITVAGNAVTGIDFALTSGGGRIAGTVTSAATGLPLAGVLVFFIGPDAGLPFASAVTNASGQYLSDGGSVAGNVLVAAASNTGYQAEVYNNVNCPGLNCDADGATLVPVTLGATTSGIDFALDVGGGISGTVTDANGAPLANVKVRIYDSTGGKVDDSPVTNLAGQFTSTGLPSGTYYAGTRNNLGLADITWTNLVCAGNRCDHVNGTPISVMAPNTTSGINFALPAGATITGTVSAAAGGAPVANAQVSIFNAAGQFVGDAFTNNAGAYTTGALPTGVYFAAVAFNLPSGIVAQVYNQITCGNNNCGSFTNGTPIPVTAGTPVTSINFSLLAAGTGSITGTVTNSSLSALNNVQVILVGTNGTQQIANVNTLASGVYTFANVAAGSYYVRTNSGSFINEVHPNIVCLGCNSLTSGGQLVTVTNGATTSNIDFALDPGGRFSGTITNAAGNAAIAGIGVQIFNAAGVALGTFNSNALGVYTTTGLPDGTYHARTTNTQGFVNKQWNGLECPQAGCSPTAGTPIVVSGTATMSGFDFSLTLGGRISGKLTDATTQGPIGFTSVTIFSSSGVNLGNVNTDVSGNYTSQGLPPGNYHARTAAGTTFLNGQQVGYIDQLWNGTVCVPACLNPTVGTPIAVTSGATTGAINFALSLGGAVSGAVVDAGALTTGLGSMGVQLFTAAGTFAKGTTTNSAGGYTVGGLPAGNYYAKTSSGGSQFYQDELYREMPCGAGCSVTSGTPITVPPLGMANGVNFTLASGAGSLSGTVTDAVTAAAVTAVAVQIYAPDGTLVKFTNTNLAGAFSVGGLAPGTYYARTAVPAGSVYDDQLFDGKACGATCTVTSGTAIVVTGGATRTGVDFKLAVKVITLSPTALNFVGTNAGGTLSPLTAPQNVAVTFPAGWTAAADQPWVQITNGSGTGNGTFTVGIINPNSILAGTTNATATVTVTPGVANSAPQTVTVSLSLTIATLTLSPTTLNFAGTNTAGTLNPLTGPQNVAVTFPFGWTAAADQPWVQITNGSGTGDGTFTVGIINPNNVLAATTSATATVTVTPGIANIAPKTVTVSLTLTITPPTMALDKSSLQFAATSSGSAFTQQTGGQTVRLTQTGGSGSVTWTATPDKPWITVSPASGTGPATLTVEVKFDSSLPVSALMLPASALTLPASASSSGAVSLVFTGASNASASIGVTLTTMAPEASNVPTGAFDTPQDNATGVTGSIAVTGWALDDLGVEKVEIFRDPEPGEGTNLVFIGRAVLVEGARPDVANQNPTTPRNTQAGWGYLMLTNFLPNLGNGTFRITAIVTDVEGKTTKLGPRTITCTNNTATKPFGAIDTPGQGETVSGTIPNFGWVLAPGSGNYADPPDGGTVTAYIDGTPIGTPGGWVSRADLTALFSAASYPGVSKALGVIGIDTTSVANGVHSIFWVVTATNGETDGIGSRFITVANSSLHTASTIEGQSGLSIDAQPATGASVRLAAPALLSPSGISDAQLRELVNSAPQRQAPIMGRRGFNLTAPFNSYSPANGPATMTAEELDRIELHFNGEPESATAGVAGEAIARHYTGYMRVGANLGPLPIGSHLDNAAGVFTWTPGVGFIHDYDLVFVRWSEGRVVDRAEIRVTLLPRGTNRVGPQVTIDAPAPDSVVESRFLIGGWALDAGADVGTGVDSLHVWAYPVCASSGVGSCGEPVFLGATAYGGTRPDVGAVFGERFTNSGYGLIVDGLPPGTYDLAVFAWSSASGRFAPARIVRVTVR
jgi:hypothetical protein